MSLRILSLFPRIHNQFSNQSLKTFSSILSIHTHLSDRFCNFQKAQISHSVFSSYEFKTSNGNRFVLLSGGILKNDSWQASRRLAVPCSYSTSNPCEKKPSLAKRFKQMFKDYWYVIAPVHLATSAVWFGSFYYMAVSGVDIVKLLEVIGAPESWINTLQKTKAGGIVTAYTLYKIFTPARYTVTLGGTTISIQYLTKWGWIKPMPSRQELRTMYDHKKTQFRDLKTTYHDKIVHTKEEIKDEFIKTHKDVSQHLKEVKNIKGSLHNDVEELKQGVREAADEWKHVGKLVKQRTGELFEKDTQNIIKKKKD